MNRSLRFLMVALVLVNLAFVAITEGARWAWLGPLFFLTLVSPWLVRLARFRSARVAWNLALIGVFALLIHHAVDVGVGRLLEDGLLLAALCQVHLLNNIRTGQKPDLLFFNSFLIAVVTSFLSIDVQYSVLFLIYAPLLIVGMQVLALTKMGIAFPVRRTVLGGLWRSAVVLAATMLVFMLVPRDFHRRGLIGDRLRVNSKGAGGEVDFNDRVLLDRTGEVGTSDRVVLRVRGKQHLVPAYWRGATMDRFEGYGWKPSRGYYTPNEVWRQTRSGWWKRNGPAYDDELEVVLASPRSQRVFLPLAARRLKVKPPAHALRIHPMPDLTFWYPRYHQAIAYSVRIGSRLGRLGGAIRKRPRGAYSQYARLRRNLVPDEALEMAAEIRKRFPSDVAQHEFVEAVRANLSTRYQYLPPGAKGGARNLRQFIRGARGGHCEYFATALVVMLRSQGVPSRMVTGYRSDEWNALSETLMVRALHAHAWAEVLDPQAGWYTVDATPAMGEAAAAAGTGFFKRLQRLAEGLWAKVTGFDEAARTRTLEWLSSLPRRLLWPAVVLLSAAVGLYWRRRRREPIPVRAYRRALRRQRVTLEPGETPRQLLARAPELEEATAAHERARYAVSE